MWVLVGKLTGRPAVRRRASAVVRPIAGSRSGVEENVTRMTFRTISGPSGPTAGKRSSVLAAKAAKWC